MRTEPLAFFKTMQGNDYATNYHNQMVQSNRNLFSLSFGAQSSKIKMLAGPHCFWGGSLLCFHQLLWPGHPPIQSLPPSSYHLLCVCVCLLQGHLSLDVRPTWINQDDHLISKILRLITSPKTFCSSMITLMGSRDKIGMYLLGGSL